MKILLLGKNGQVGWELQRSLAPLGEVIALDHDGAHHAARHLHVGRAVVMRVIPVGAARMVGGQRDLVSRTFNVKLDLPPTEGLRTGQFGRVSVPVAETKLLLVPQSAVLKRGQMEIVFVAKDGKAALRLVKTGKVLDARVEVLSGIEEGEQVIVSDIARLADGQPVTVQP